MNPPVLKVEGLSHKYSKAWAIRDINFEIRERGILGLLGSNGAGKSTTMNIICGALQQTEGKVYIDGISMEKNPEEGKKRIGFLPQNPPLHVDLTVDEYLIHCAHMRLMSSHQIPGALEEVKERCGISHFSKRLIRNLSGGYRQRTGIAQAIIHKPKLVVLDEPTNGLDPMQILEVRNLIRDIAKERFVIFSSHILSEIQATCKYIIMIERGKLVFSDTMAAFNNYASATTLLVTLDNPPSLAEWEKIDSVQSAEQLYDSTYRVRFNGPKDITKKIVELSVANNWQLKEITLEKSSLEEVFAQLSRTAG